MDSGLGSDEERRILRPLSNASSGIGSVASTKEQKQRHNERLLIGCFIDASSLSDDAEIPPSRPSISNSEACGIDLSSYDDMPVAVNNHPCFDAANNQCFEARNTAACFEKAGKSNGKSCFDDVSASCFHESNGGNQYYEACGYEVTLPKSAPWTAHVSTSNTGNSSSSSNGDEERRQGALLFRNSIPQYSMLQMELNMHHRLHSDSYSSGSQQDLRSEYDHDKEDETEKEDLIESNCDKFVCGSLNFRTGNDSGAPSMPLFDYCDNDIAAQAYITKKDKHSHVSSSEDPASCSTPFNSMVQLATGNVVAPSPRQVLIEEDCEKDSSSEEIKRKSEEEAERHKTSLGFYVDLNDVEDPKPQTANKDNANSKKNIFSMVIDFEAPKKEKPRLPSSLRNGNGSKDSKKERNGDSNSHPHSGNGKKPTPPPTSLIIIDDKKVQQDTLKIDLKSLNHNDKYSDESEMDVDKEESPAQSFVRLSDLDCSSSRTTTCSDLRNNSKNDDQQCEHALLDLNRIGAMSRSIPPPPQSFVESPLFLSMSRSVAAYRSTPPPFNSQTHQRLSGISSRGSSASNSRPSSGGSRSVARLGTDLLRMFLEEIETDVQVSVNGRKIRAHRCILVSRCQYFAASLSGRPGESLGAEIIIPLDGFSYDSVHFAMCHIYSGASHVPDSVSLVELASLADLLCLEGLKEVVSKELLQKHCHAFHVPCTSSLKTSRSGNKNNENDGGCIEGVLEVLPLAAAYGLDELYQKCLEWIAEHFVRVWPTRAFGQLPRELRDKSHRHMEVHLLPENVFFIAKGCLEICHTLEDRISNSRWIETVQQLSNKLYDNCQSYLKSHFAQSIDNVKINFIAERRDWKHSDVSMKTVRLFSVSNSSEADMFHQLDAMIILVCKSITAMDHMCRCHIATQSLLKAVNETGEPEENERELKPFLNLLNKLVMILEEKILNAGEKITRCNSWNSVHSNLKEKLKAQLKQEKEDDSSYRSTPSFKGNSPPITRLPRATRTTQVRESAARKRQQQAGGNAMLQSSSESSSRNSSPLTRTRQVHVSSTRDMTKSNIEVGKNKAATNGTNASPSLRRSLLMAARVPQKETHVPPSPLQQRRSTSRTAVPHTTTTTGSTNANMNNRTVKSTLTQPTASSKAKNAPPRHIKVTQSTTVSSQQKSQSAPSSYRSDNLMGKQSRPNSGMTRSTTHSTARKPEPISNNLRQPIRQTTGPTKSASARSVNRAQTPTMGRKRLGSNASCASSVVSPCSVTSESRYITEHGKAKATSSSKSEHAKQESPQRRSSKPNKEDKILPNLEETPTIQRSGTFLKEKPTVLTIEHQKNPQVLDATVH